MEDFEFFLAVNIGWDSVGFDIHDSIVEVFSELASSDNGVVDVFDLVLSEVIQEDFHGVPGDIVADVVHTEVKNMEVVEGVVDVSRLASVIGSFDDLFGVLHSPVNVLEHQVGVVGFAVEEPADSLVDVVDHKSERGQVVGAVFGVPVGSVLFNVLGSVVDDPSEIAGGVDGLLQVLGLIILNIERLDKFISHVFAQVVHSVVNVKEGNKGNISVVVVASI